MVQAFFLACWDLFGEFCSFNFASNPSSTPRLDASASFGSRAGSSLLFTACLAFVLHHHHKGRHPLSCDTFNDFAALVDSEVLQVSLLPPQRHSPLSTWVLSKTSLRSLSAAVGGHSVHDTYPSVRSLHNFTTSLLQATSSSSANCFPSSYPALVSSSPAQSPHSVFQLSCALATRVIFLCMLQSRLSSSSPLESSSCLGNTQQHHVLLLPVQSTLRQC